ncbi:hypothetical protein D3C75_980250 [compost metagenome]
MTAILPALLMAFRTCFWPDWMPPRVAAGVARFGNGGFGAFHPWPLKFRFASASPSCLYLLLEPLALMCPGRTMSPVVMYSRSNSRAWAITLFRFNPPFFAAVVAEPFICKPLSMHSLYRSLWGFSEPVMRTSPDFNSSITLWNG